MGGWEYNYAIQSQLKVGNLPLMKQKPLVVIIDMPLKYCG